MFSGSYFHLFEDMNELILNELYESTFKMKVTWFLYFILNRVQFSRITKIPIYLQKRVRIIVNQCKEFLILQLQTADFAARSA